MSDREEFECVMHSRGRTDLDLRTDADSDYVIPSVQECWEVWQAARECDPAWTSRLNTCTYHGDDHEACAVYGGQVPCDLESESGND